MYNRYIPQPDGSYRRSQSREQAPQQRKSAPEPQKKEVTPPPKQEERKIPPCRRESHQSQGILDFFRQLLPRELDTADLLIVLLLLLMAGDDREEQNNALLTLALYLFM